MPCKVSHISRSFGPKQFALRDISFEAYKGEIVALLGESGSGKTTLLRLLAGFEIPDQGSITVNGKTVADDHTFVAPEKRRVGLVFQDNALFPHLRVAANVAFGVARKNKRQKTDEMLNLVGLRGYESRYPHELSGGQQQRVAIARSLAAESDLLLLDEPFSNLDDTLKNHVRNEIRDILHSSGKTAVFVTHDIQDCLAVADKILVLKEGRGLQFGTPEYLYRNPEQLYTARLFGQVNVIPPHLARLLDPNSNPALTSIARPHQLQLSDDASLPSLRCHRCRFAGSSYEVSLWWENALLTLYSQQPVEEGALTHLKLLSPLIQVPHE